MNYKVAIWRAISQTMTRFCALIIGALLAVAGVDLLSVAYFPDGLNVIPLFLACMALVATAGVGIFWMIQPMNELLRLLNEIKEATEESDY